MRAQQGDEHHGKQGKAIFTGAGRSKSHGNKPGNHHKGARQHRKCGRFKSPGRRLPAESPASRPETMVSTVITASSTEQTQRDNQCAEKYAADLFLPASFP